MFYLFAFILYRGIRFAPFSLCVCFLVPFPRLLFFTVNVNSFSADIDIFIPEQVFNIQH